MAYQLSPGVYTSEVDLTTAIPAVATTVGAYAGNFVWGPVDEVRIIDNEVKLVDTFGKPNANTFTDFFTAANFLSYSNDMRVARAANNSTVNATSSNTGIQVKNVTDYEQNHSTGVTTDTFCAKYPGSLGNGIGVIMMDGATFANTNTSITGVFSSAPSTSDYVSLKGGKYDEMHIIVYDTTGTLTGSANTVLEKFAFVSKAGDAKNSDGTSNYYKDVVNTKSKWIWWLGHQSALTATAGKTAANTTFGNLTITYGTTLDGGVDAALTDADRIRSFSLFSNPDSIGVSLIASGDASTTVANHVINMAVTRGDALAFVSPTLSNVVDNVGNEATAISTTRSAYTSTSFAVMDSGWKYQYDKYNDTYRWIPLNGDIAGLCAYTDSVRDPWYSPAGFNRGLIKNVVKLAWNPTQAERDALYKGGINPVVTFPGEGTVLFGDKTLLSRPSAFDRINVRRLFIVLKKAISKASRSSLFEVNDEFTRAQFISLVEPYLRNVQGRRGIYDFRVVCDSTNNTPDIIDREEFVGDIYIKPSRSVNFIQLNFVAVRTGVNFEEVVGKF